MVDNDIRAGQFHDFEVQAVGVGEDICPAVVEATEEEGQRENQSKAPKCKGKTHLEDSLCGQNGPISQWVADGHEPIKSHGQEDRRLHKGEGVDEEQLGKTGAEGNLSKIKPKDAQHRRQRGEAQAQVCQGQHGKKIVHGLMQARISSYDMENGKVAQEHRHVDEAERDRNPVMGIF